MKQSSILLLPFAVAQADKAKSDTAFTQGKAFYQSGDFKKARAYFLDVMKENPQNTRAQEYLRHVQAAVKHGVKPRVYA
jgi:TolA-binding protein